MSKILFIGGSVWQLPPLQYAKKKKIKTILVDYDQNAPGKKYADKFYKISIIDKKKILSKAKDLKIDGVVSYGSDIAAPTSAYISEKLKLPGNPYKSVKTLTNKYLFRKFLKKNKFNVPKFKSFSNEHAALSWIEKVGYPVFIKPVDSSGSRGVSIIKTKNDFKKKFLLALKHSIIKKIIIEKPIFRKSYQVAGDGFISNGKLKFHCWGNEHFEKLCNGIVPIGESFPSIHKDKLLTKARKETQRIIDLLKLKMGALNFDFVFDEKDELYFIEIGPRNGGCLIPEVIYKSTKMNLIKLTVDASLGNISKNFKQLSSSGYWSSYMIHSLKNGILKNIKISSFLKKRIIEENIWVKKNQKVYEYDGGDKIIGTLILKFKNFEEMIQVMDNMENYIKINLCD